MQSIHQTQQSVQGLLGEEPCTPGKKFVVSPVVAHFFTRKNNVYKEPLKIRSAQECWEWQDWSLMRLKNEQKYACWQLISVQHQDYEW